MPVHFLTFNRLRESNKQRCESVFFPLDYWSPMQWGCALGGEAGEALNFLKKIERDGRTAELLTAVGKELADVVLYADLTASALGLPLERFVVEKFNEVSDRKASPIKLELKW